MVNSRHDNVKRTIESLVQQGNIVRPQIEDVPDADAMGRVRTTKVYNIGERDGFVIVARLSPKFTARLVDFWQKHKNEPTVDPAAFLNDPTWLRGALKDILG